MNSIQTTFIKKTLALCLLLYLSTNYSTAQSCNDVFDFCPPTNKLFNQQSFARSYKIKPHQKLQLVQVFYGGTGYHINLCKDDSLGDFRIKILDFATKNILWDNIDDHYSSSISISFGSTQRIFMEITPQNPEKFRNTNICIGVVVRYYRDEEIKDSSPPEDPTGF